MWKFYLSTNSQVKLPLPVRKNGKERPRKYKEGINLHEDLIIEVLSRLPLKTLARFKCVSKQWHALIYNMITVENRPKLLLCSKFLCNSLFHSLDHKTRVENMYLLESTKVKVHSSCYGLLLIQVDTLLCLWNPLTQFFSKVFIRNAFDRRIELADLCFDYATDEYKILVYGQYFSVFTCCGYDNRIDVPLWVSNPRHGPFFNGYRHWICQGYDDTPNHITYFDPATDTFVEVPMPQPKNGVRDTFFSLGVLKGCLCMTRLEDPQIHEGNIEFLVMKKYGNGESWDIMFVISNIPECRRYHHIEPLSVTKEGEILVCIRINDSGRIVRAYDVYGNFLRDMTIPSFGKCFSSVILYEESWFSTTIYDRKEWNYHPYNYWGYHHYYYDYYLEDHPFWELCHDLELWELESFFEEDFWPRKKKMNKKMEKKSHNIKITNSKFYKRSCVCSSFDIQTRRKGRKANKRIYESKYGNNQRFHYI